MSIRLPAKSPTVVFKEMDEGGVLFCSRTEVYFGVNQAGAIIWDLLPEAGGAGAGALDAVVDALQAAFPEVSREQLDADAREFLRALEENELATYAGSEETPR